MSITPNTRFPQFEDCSVTEIKDPNVADCIVGHIKQLECRLAELQKTQHTWLVNNPTVIPDSDPDFRALRQVIKKVKLDLEISRRQQPVSQEPEETIVNVTSSITDTPVLPRQRQKSRFIVR